MSDDTLMLGYFSPQVTWLGVGLLPRTRTPTRTRTRSRTRTPTSTLSPTPTPNPNPNPNPKQDGWTIHITDLDANSLSANGGLEDIEP